MTVISENLLVELVERQPEEVDLVVVLDQSSGVEVTFPVTDIPKVKRRLNEAHAAGEQVLDIKGILIERAAWDALDFTLGYFMGASLDQFTPADYE